METAITQLLSQLIGLLTSLSLLLSANPGALSEAQRATLSAALGQTTGSSQLSAPLPPPNPSALNAQAREAVVNILCTTRSGGFFEPISGSGIVIDPRGIILTNAHVAQYFLLKDFQVPNFIDCTIRTGNPAAPAYKAELIYLSERWVEKNAPQIKLSRSFGTGQNDFALLRITRPVQPGNTLPSQFPALSPDISFNTLEGNDPVLLVSYPAELLGGILTQTNLNQVSSLGEIKQGFFFEGNASDELDLFSLGGNIVAQGGSSGGAVVNSENGTLAGILVTSTAAATTNEKDLKGLSLSHISRSLKEETGNTLPQFLSRNLDELAAEFAPKFLRLKNILETTIRSGS